MPPNQTAATQQTNRQRHHPRTPHLAQERVVNRAIEGLDAAPIPQPDLRGTSARRHSDFGEAQLLAN